MSGAREPDLNEQIGCVERELGLRRRVYPRQVAQRKMTQEYADRQIAEMEAVLETLKAFRDLCYLVWGRK